MVYCYRNGSDGNVYVHSLLVLKSVAATDFIIWHRLNLVPFKRLPVRSFGQIKAMNFKKYSNKCVAGVVAAASAPYWFQNHTQLFNRTSTYIWYQIMVICAYLQMHKNTHVIDQFDTFVVVSFDLAGVNS